MDTAVKRVRSSNFELLRILSMVMIVAHHYALYSGFSFDTHTLSAGRFFVQILSSGGKVGVNLFVLISGYFLLNATFRVKKAVQLLAEILFYSVGITLLCTVTGLVPFSFKMLLKSLLPISQTMYWFASVYFVLYLLSAFLAPALGALSQKKLLALWAVLFVLWCVFPTFLIRGAAFSELGWFIFLFVTAVYLKRFPPAIFTRGGICFLLSLFFYALMLLSVCTLELLGTKITAFAANETYFLAMHRIPAYGCSVFLFFAFANLKMKPSRWINRIASCMFGAYLLHDHPVLSAVLWKDLFGNASFANSALLPVHAFCTIILILAAGILIDFIRQLAFERPFLALYDRAERAVLNRIHKKRSSS